MNRASENTANVANTTTSEGTSYPSTPADISDIISNIFLNYVSTAVGVFISSLGVTASVINTIIYWRQGITESVNITFISLSLWNLFGCCVSFISEICRNIEKFAPLQSVNMLAVHSIYFSYTRGFFFILTTFVTVYLSMERCICIIIPFTVKDIFTTPRVILANLIIVLLGLACFSPGWATQGMHLVFNPKTNKTRLDLWVAANRSGIDYFLDMFPGFALPALAQIIITVSTWYMLHGINSSKKFRQKCAKPEKAAFGLHADNRSKIMTSKEVKLTKVVVLLALVFLVCNVPLFTISCLKVFDVDFSVGRQHILFYNVIFWFRIVNCIVNMLVYYKVSSRYRKEFLILFTSVCFNNYHG